MTEAIVLGYALAYLPLLSDRVPPTETVLLSLPACLVIAAGGLLAAVKLARYSGYREAVSHHRCSRSSRLDSHGSISGESTSSWMGIGGNLPDPGFVDVFHDRGRKDLQDDVLQLRSQSAEVRFLSECGL